MDLLTLALVSGVISGVTQLTKKYAKVNPLVLLALLAMVGGGVVTAFKHFATPELLKFVGAAWVTAISIYQTLKEVYEGLKNR